jgi:hypothetical protein
LHPGGNICAQAEIELGGNRNVMAALGHRKINRYYSEKSISDIY